MTAHALTRPADGGGLVSAAMRALRTWIERDRQRMSLAGLDDHMLRDIGLTRADAEAEAAKAFWQA
jgi:uncharacterized protein YjiS (DUF1127 family)